MMPRDMYVEILGPRAAGPNGATPGHVLAGQRWYLAEAQRRPVNFLRNLFNECVLPVARIHDVARKDYARFEELLWNAFVAALKDGEAVLVRKNTMDLVEHAAGELDPDDTIEMDAPPFRSAFVYFQRPILANAIGVEEGTSSPLPGACDGFVYTKVSASFITSQDVSIYFFFLRRQNDPNGFLRSFGIILLTDQSHVRGWDNHEITRRSGISPTELFNPKPFTESLWSLMNQPIISEQIERPIDPVSRKSRKVFKHGGNVRVLHIRQRKAPEGSVSTSSGSSTREFTHQWIVRGFWRNQACGPKMKDHKRVWIDSYVKGPVGTPLIVGGKVYVE